MSKNGKEKKEQSGYHPFLDETISKPKGRSHVIHLVVQFIQL
jgi:hypothetical protein